MDNPDSTPLLTEADVTSWVERRNALREELAHLERKVAGFRLMFPDIASRLIANWGAMTPALTTKAKKATKATADKADLPLHEQPITSVVLALLEGEETGHPTRWFRERMAAIPGLAERDSRSPTGLSNALSRLAKSGKLKKIGESYYLPEIYERVRSGEITECVEESRVSFNAMMHAAMRDLKRPFKAADAVEVAKHVPELSAKLAEQPTRVYSWLGRETFKHKLRKNGEFYSYPSERDEALNGQAASAPFAGEVAASPSKDLYDL